MKGRFFVTPDAGDPDRARLDAAGARHLRALRLAPGDQVCAIVGPGRERSATITALARDHVLLALGADLAGPSRDPQAPRTLALALGDPVRMDLVIEKATELGATAIQPFVAARSQARGVGDGRLERWRRIARAACEQCGRTVEPDVRACVGLDVVLDLVATAAEAWLLSPWRADESSAARRVEPSPPPVLQPGELLLVVGPEGGLSDDESTRLLERGARPITLGRRVLRFETAAIAALTLALARDPEQELLAFAPWVWNESAMVNCVDCGAPLERDGDPCEACGAATNHEPRNGARHPRIEDPDGLVYEDSPLVRGDADHLDRHRAAKEPSFVDQPLRDDPSVFTPAFATAPLVAEPVAQPAHFASRALALVIDLVILSVLDVVLFALATSAVLLAERLTGTRVGGATELVRASLSAGSMTLFLAYFAVLHARSGQTLGKVALRIHVRDEDGARVGLARSILRTCGYGLSALPLGAGFLLALGPARRALHDRIAGTVVVREERVMSRGRRLRLGFVMDPLPAINIDKDTTFVFLLEAQERAHEIFYIAPRDLALLRSTPQAGFRSVNVRRKAGDHFTLGEPRRENLDWFDAVFLRKDPPFDLDFFFDTHIASMIDQRRTLVINEPRGLREANEKLYALNFPGVIPDSLVTSSSARLKEFLGELGGEMIVKPLDGCGGSGVFHLHRGDRNINAILETITVNDRRPVMAQRYIPEVRTGDKRIILIDGKARGAILRVPSAEETRSNLHVGGSAVACEMTPRDHEICDLIGPRLRADGLVFVGIDVIGDYLTEINVTSPTGLQEITQLYGTRLEIEMIDWVERAAAGLDR